MMRGIGVIGGLFGAGGVTLLALGAHHTAGASLTSAGQMLLFHAPVLLLIALQPHPMRVMRIAVLLIGAGVLLFSGDIALRHLTPIRLFPMAAPIGGSLTILGWLTLAFALGSRKSA